MAKTRYKIKSEVWEYPGQVANWFFVSLPKKESAQIKKDFGAKAKGWGSVPVEVTIGKTSWKTSIFPEKKSETYVLPVKASVRKAEGVYKGDKITFQIEIGL